MSTTNTTSYGVTPANNHCKSEPPTVVQPQPGSASYESQKMIDTNNKQQTANTQYDNINSENTSQVTSKTAVQNDSYGMAGGSSKSNTFIIFFKKNKYTFNDKNNDNNVSKMIKTVLNNKIYKEDNLMKIKCNNNTSIYIIKGHQKNKFKKIY